MSTFLERPTEKLVKDYIEIFKNDQRYYPADNAIINLFKVFPHNTKIEDILLKISVLNDLYSTNIFATFDLAKHILSLNIDLKLAAGDTTAVKEIATGHGIISSKNNREITFYSFATKYCNWHNQENYAIYDSFVEKVLMAYKKQDSFASFRKDDLKSFSRFKSIIEEFTSYYNLTRFSLKEMDKFLWVLGKEKFPTNYKQKEKK